MVTATLNLNPVIDSLSIKLESNTDETINDLFLEHEIDFCVQNNVWTDISLPIVKIAGNTFVFWYLMRKQTANRPNKFKKNLMFRSIEEFLEVQLEKEARRK